MINLVTNLGKKSVLIIPLAVVAALFFGCAPHRVADGKAAGAKSIMDIITSENSESMIVTIKGNQPLIYTAIKQVFPMGVLFHFPETSLGNVKAIYQPPANEIISSIKAAEIVEDKTTTSRIFIALKKDVPYDLAPDDAGLRVSFPKAVAKPQAGQEKLAPEKPVPKPAKKSIPAATRLKSVTATPLKSSVVVNIKADGAIKDFKSFTIDDKKPRIVFDLYRIKSPFKKEQRIPVKSKWLKRVRHFGYPDKVRLVLDTHKNYLSKYSSSPTDNGLLIHVGKVSAAPIKAAATKPVVVEKAKPATPVKKAPEAKPAKTVISAKPAWINRIDFSSGESGKSALIIGTTQPVQYDLKKVADKKLHLKLLNTNLPAYRKRALITTRFESAVDRITPIQSPEMKKDSLISIELREAVPYFVEQTDNTIRINFAASSIPPKPYEDADLPAWKEVLAEVRVEPEKKVAKEKVAQAKVEAKKPEKKVAEARAQTLEERVAAARPEKKYTGEKIALDFFDTDIKNVFRILREISGKNFAIDKNVTGKVTLTLERPVPWDQVLDLVLKMNQLGMTMEGDIIRIATLNTLAQEEKLKQAKLKAEQAALKQQIALEPLFTEYIPINYSNAKTEILPHVQAIITENRGKVSVDERNNQLILTDTAEKILQAKEIVEKIDQVTPQVTIEARIVEANSNFTRDLGVDWGTVTLGPFDIGDTFTTTLTGFADNLPFNILPTGELGIDLFKIKGTPFSIVDAAIQVSEVEGKTNIVSSPRIVTLHNKKAKIKQGFEVPYLERDSSGNATVRFKDVDLLLEVTPQVTLDNRIVMSIFITKNDLVDPTADEPALSTNEAETEILVDDGDTIVIGGILKSTLTWGERGIPGLRNTPVLGWLFKSEKSEERKNELLIFMSPRIIHLEQKKLS